MTGIGYVMDEILPRNVINVVFDGIHRPVGIVGADEDHFRHRQPIPVGVRVDHGGQCLPLR